MAVPRRLAAILAADVAGYSRLMGADEEDTHERLRAHLGQLVEPKIREHNGRTVKHTGDGLLAEFASVIDAVRCAAEVQRGMIDREPQVPEERRIRFRIGVNLGDIIVEAGDIFGDGVNVAARLEALAEPGGICVAQTVHDQIRDKLPYPFVDIGEQSVKNIARPVRAHALRPDAVADLPASSLPISPPRRRRTAITALAAGAATALIIGAAVWGIWPPPKPSDSAAVAAANSVIPHRAPRLSIVVLPFANLSRDPDQQYFADGITEDLTTDLSRVADMLVISAKTAFTYQRKAVDAKQIGRELGVRYVLEGSVERAGRQVRVNAQLINAAADAHLWADRFDRDIGDLLALQNEITGRIAVALNFALIKAEAAHPTANPDALDYVFRGRAVLSKPPSRDSYAQAIALFERALVLDPRSAQAQLFLAFALTSRVNDGFDSTAAADIARAEGLVRQVVAASPENPLAHEIRGNLLRGQRRFADAIPEYETVIALDSNYPYAYANLANCKLYLGPLDEVIPLTEKAIRLSPRDPALGYFYLMIGAVHLLRSHPDEAIVWLEMAQTANPAHTTVHSTLAAAYGLKGETEHAAAELAEERRLRGNPHFLSSIARARAARYFMAPKIRALFEATYDVGWRQAGVPEE
jgi:adenylate cyclase